MMIDIISIAFTLKLTKTMLCRLQKKSIIRSLFQLNFSKFRYRVVQKSVSLLVLYILRLSKCIMFAIFRLLTYHLPEMISAFSFGLA